MTDKLGENFYRRACPDCGHELILKRKGMGCQQRRCRACGAMFSVKVKIRPTPAKECMGNSTAGLLLLQKSLI